MKTYSLEIKRKAYERIDAGAPFDTVAKELGVPENILAKLSTRKVRERMAKQYGAAIGPVLAAARKPGRPPKAKPVVADATPAASDDVRGELMRLRAENTELKRLLAREWAK